MLRALGLALVLAALAYGYFAFGPTGYREFAAEHGDALEWADRLLARSETGTAGAAAGEPADLIRTIEDLGAAPPPAALDPPGFARWAGERYLFSAEGFVSGPLRASVADSALAHEQIAAVVKAVREAERELPASSGPALDDEELQSTLDRVATFLEGRWSTPRFQSFPVLRESQLASYHYWAAFAILRAAGQGRSAAAAEMLAQYLESLRILHHGQFPQPRVSFTVAQRLLLSLPRIEGFPGDGLERARRIVQRIRLSAEELQQIRIAHALRWHDEFLQDLDEERIPSYDNAWGRFASGWPARLARSGLEPIQRRSADHISRAWAENSMPFQPHWKYIFTPRHGLVNPLAVRAGTSVVMNQDLRRYSDHHDLARPVDDRLLDLDHGGRARWLELVLALALFERDHGGPPAGIEALVPQYLDPEFLEEHDVSWLPHGAARAVWTLETVADDRGQVTPVLCRWIRGELRYRERQGAIRPVFAWKADRLDEMRRDPRAMFPTPDRATVLEVVDLALLFP